MYLNGKITVCILVVILNVQYISGSKLIAEPFHCEENTNWRALIGYQCIDYKRNGWCKNGEVGSEWINRLSWHEDINGLSARSVCCICGGAGNLEPKSCQQYNGDHFMYFAAKHLEVNLNEHFEQWQTKQLENGCEGAIKFLTSPGLWDPKRDVVCDAVVDSVLDGLVTSESLKQWVRWFYDAPRVGIDRYTTKFSDICPCSCTP